MLIYKTFLQIGSGAEEAEMGLTRWVKRVGDLCTPSLGSGEGSLALPSYERSFEIRLNN